MGTMSDTTKWVRMYQSPKLEFVVNQDVWYNSETRMADVILPACTNFERDDIGEWAACGGYTTNSHTGNNYRVIVREQKCIEPLWESKSDYEIFADLSERLGLRDEFTDGGKTEIDWAKAFFDCSDLPKTSTGRSSTRRATTSSTLPSRTSRSRACAGSPRAAPATRPTPATPSAAPTRRTNSAPTAARSSSRPRASRRTSPTTRSGPSLRGTSRAGRATTRPSSSTSTRCSSCRRIRASRSTATTTSTPTGSTTSRSHRIKKDGYAWWPARINPADAAERGIRNGDIVRLYNDRGSVLCFAVVTGRVRPGIVHSYASSAKYDPLSRVEPGKADSIDKGGCVNMLTPSRMISKHAPGMTPNSCLIEIEKWEG